MAILPGLEVSFTELNRKKEIMRIETVDYAIWDCWPPATAGDYTNTPGAGARIMDVILNDFDGRSCQWSTAWRSGSKNKRLKDLVRELKVKGGEHVCELFARVQVIQDSMGDLSKRFGEMKLE